ncbi:MAG: tyrosine-type recombinase/integrase [Nitrosopumilaceae archaeon]|nr:tyrosine-type recombinase/integrase [Nitrosopumilaceae archaeon]NIU01587.1 tyrosine-type recombinase/integrase [Nitrosopumilaceae archaeon]NIU88006.1 tyrosine-type recombinase/integrase [Nitrosopumilaceae archaeon]NIV66273.1 tyrosine-type recombinase/integrase [Nitrosopumilaceae archaeon]NIX62189.1 tyrosine-type recombinase/integrase [Nitrosopumilaceae archaeon]
MEDQQSQDMIEKFLLKKFRISRSFGTKRTYEASLKNAQKFLLEKKDLQIPRLLTLIHNGKIDPLDLLDDYYSYLSQVKRKDGRIGYSAQAIKDYVSIFKSFLNSEGCKVYDEDLKQRFKLPKVQDTYQEGLDKETIARLVRLANPKLATVILIAISSGMRIGEILQLRVSDVDLEKNPAQINVRASTTKTRQARITHLSTEASVALKDHISRCSKSGDDYLFLINHKERIEKIKRRLAENNYKQKGQRALDIKNLKPLESSVKNLSDEEILGKSLWATQHNFESQLQRLVKSTPDLSKKGENGRNQVHFHAFRYFFKTQVTDAHQSDFAEALMGHKSLKLVYYRQNEKARARTYLEVEPYLTISDAGELDRNYSNLQKSNSELRVIVESYGSRLQELERRLEEKNTH